MKIVMKPNWLYVGLTLILVTACGLRIWGIWFGLPFSYRADEYHEVFRALELGSGGFNFDRTGKGGYFYLLFVEYGMLFVALKIAGIVDSAQEFARYFFRDASLFYLIGRATTAVIGTINVYLLYRLGSRAYATGAGLLAALFLAVDFLNAEHSHFITVDVPMTCLATAALLFAVRIAHNGTSSDYKWAALFAALATTTKLPAILLVVPLVIAHYYRVKQQDGVSRRFFLRPDLWWAVGVFVVVLGVTNPGLFMRPPLGVLHMFGSGVEVGEEELADLMSVAPPNLFAFYLGVLRNSMGWPLLLVSFAGVLYGLWKRTPADVILVSFAAVFYVSLASTSSHLYFPRYMLPVIVVLTLMAGRVLYDVWPGASALRQLAAAAVLVVLVGIPTYDTVANNILLTKPDTRTIAKEWFEEHVPADSKVLIDGLTIEPARLTIPLHNSAANLREVLEYYKSVNDRGKVTYLQFKLQVLPEITYDLELYKRSDLASFAYDNKPGVEYVVIRPESFSTSRRSGMNASAFLDELRSDPDVSLVKSFRADGVSVAGPDIDVYRIDSSTNGD